MALLALILASSLAPAIVAPERRQSAVDRSPWIATVCSPQMDARFVHIPKPAPSLRTVHVTQGEATPCRLQRGPDYSSRRTVRMVQHDDPVRPIE